MAVETDVDAARHVVHRRKYKEENIRTNPSEEEVVEYLIGEEDVPHDVVIDGNRVHATAMFEERPDDPTDG